MFLVARRSSTSVLSHLCSARQQNTLLEPISAINISSFYSSSGKGSKGSNIGRKQERATIPSTPVDETNHRSSPSVSPTTHALPHPQPQEAPIDDIPLLSSSLSSSPVSSSPSRSVSRIKPVYMHPLSQMVLQHLQEHCQDWMTRKNLRYLQVHRDGTFWLTTIPQHRNEPNNNVKNHVSNSSVWTCYDETEKKHWLYYSKNQVQYPFLLKDNNRSNNGVTRHYSNNESRRRSSSSSSSLSTIFESHNQVQKAVQDLMQAVEELEEYE